MAAHLCGISPGGVFWGQGWPAGPAWGHLGAIVGVTYIRRKGFVYTGLMGRPKRHEDRVGVLVKMPRILKLKLQEKAEKESTTMTELIVRFAREGLRR